MAEKRKMIFGEQPTGKAHWIHHSVPEGHLSVRSLVVHGGQPQAEVNLQLKSHGQAYLRHRTSTSSSLAKSSKNVGRVSAETGASALFLKIEISLCSRDDLLHGLEQYE